ncbi:hypothetical protein SVIOM74S_08241 [Streptomyces violarus]
MFITYWVPPTSAVILLLQAISAAVNAACATATSCIRAWCSETLSASSVQFSSNSPLLVFSPATKVVAWLCNCSNRLAIGATSAA